MMSRHEDLSFFATAISREVWRCSRAGAEIIEEQHEHGHATARLAGETVEIEASDDFGAIPPGLRQVDGRDLERRLLAAAGAPGAIEGAITAARSTVGTLRIVSRARFVTSSTARAFDAATIVSFSPDAAPERSVMAPSHLIAGFIERLVAAPRAAFAADHRDFAIVWRGGSGAVLLHEIVGHPSEEGEAGEGWPEWLEVRDEPEIGIVAAGTDDVGARAGVRLLTRGEVPSAMRRFSFRDVPSIRMTNLVAEGRQAPFDVPDDRIEVTLVGEGAFDRLADTVRISVVASALVRRGRSDQLQPFEIEAPRRLLRDALAGAGGQAVLYPGVICSDGGSRLPVGSSAPDILTRRLGR
jgi:hypothetical protein